MPEAPFLLIVDADVEVVEAGLRSGRIGCPGCGCPVAPRGHARLRAVRFAAGGGRPPELVWLAPRRACCRGCGAWHVLLPDLCLCRRRDAVEVIGRALEAKAAGAGHRPIARELGLPETTVRGWLRRAGVLAEAIRAHFVRWAFAIEPTGAGARAAGAGVAGAVEAIGRCARAASLRVAARSPWALASALTCGALLARTSSPWLKPP